MDKQINAFFAYGSETPSCGEFVEIAIKEINNSGHSVHIKSWKQMNVGGYFLISEILREIEEADLFCCDITNLNDNVLFELGFAIARNKPIWIIQDITIAKSFQQFKEFILLNNIGYINYTSSKNIVEGFLAHKQYLSKKSLLSTLPIDDSSDDSKNILFYLKSQIDLNYNQHILETIESKKIPTLIDDSNENKISPISFYLRNLINIPAILVEFSDTSRTNHKIHNSKCSLIAGLALGLGKKYKFIAAHPYATAIDYQEHLHKFSNLTECEGIVAPFLSSIRTQALDLFAKKSSLIQYKRKDGLLQKVKFGEMLAEHEPDKIYEYYVNTANDDNLLKAEYNIVIGRKGSGKTASFYYLETKYSKHVKNQVVVIKPVNFELDGLIELISGTSIEFGKSYIIESVWKFLIYTEIIKSIYLRVKDRPLYAIKENETLIIEFVKNQKEKILPDLSSRLNQLFSELKSIKDESDQNKFRIKISEVLHQEIFKTMVNLIIEFMFDKGTLVLLIDNLDKNWKKGSNIEITSKFILGLLGVIGRINKELKGGNKNPVGIRLNLVIFLRSDIFKQLLTHAREPDKIEFTKLSWTDSEVLFRLLDKRIDYYSDGPHLDSNKFWEHYITNSVDGKPLKEFIINSIIPRPRDLIFFINVAKNNAIAKGHEMIRETDIQTAYEEYSNWIFQSLLVENGITISQLKDFFYHLVGEKSILQKSKIIETMKAADINCDEETQITYFIDHLCTLSFLGKEIRANEFHFDYGYELDDKKDFLAKKYNSNRFKIHNAFIPYLECSDYIK